MAAISREQWISRQRRNLFAFYRVSGSSAPSSSVLELDGLIASLVPSAPERSIANAVVYEDPAAAADQLDELAAAYEQAGVSAWTVWTFTEDRDLAAALGRAGHNLDGEPRLMGLELEGLDTPGAAELDWAAGSFPAEVGRLNDLAYGLTDTFTQAFAAAPETLHVHLARQRGEPVSCVGSIDIGDDCGIYLVATVPEARGQGLSGALMGQALLDARERGCLTSTLQSSALGQPVYTRLGYEDLGPIEMWERRRAD